ncbi:MAG: sulfotransferase [Rhizomicrobium sp.]
MLGEHDRAVTALRDAIDLDRLEPRAWRALSEELFAVGENAQSETASIQAAVLSIANPKFREALAQSQPRTPEGLEDAVLEFLEGFPEDAAALNLLAEISLASRRAFDAEALLERSLEIAPESASARYNYAFSLLQCGKSAEAIAELDVLVAQEPQSPLSRKLMAEALLVDGRNEDALHWHEDLVRDCPKQPLGYVGRGLALQALGRLDECIESIKETLRKFPRFAAAYWNLAGFRTAHFNAEEISAMEDRLKETDLSEEDRTFLLFALGRAYEQQKRFRESFDSYAAANALKHSSVGYNPQVLTQLVVKSKSIFTARFFQERAASGCRNDAPIFIVGLPRSGSSLVEQILSRHSSVEALGELPKIAAIARKAAVDRGARYPDVLEALGPEELRLLGEDYVSFADGRRKLSRTRITDKAPRNFCDIGLIHSILPRAKIIDVRRHPIGCCFSNFTQLYVQGQAFTYSLADLGRYYRNYVELMAHFDTVLPGKIYRLSYEQLIGNFEPELRRLLDYLELSFEEGCLRFYESERHIRTPSANQVRAPIYADAAEHWRSFEPWLDELKEALGPALSSYPSGYS